MSANMMSGGAAPSPMNNILFEHLDTIPNMMYGFIVILCIVFVDKVPAHIGGYVDTALGRIIGIAAVGLSLHYIGWTYGLLTAVAFLLLVHISTRQRDMDGFQDLEKRNVVGNRWFVETVLGECPEAIESEKANTSAVQDLSEKNMTSHGK
jgi:hypothetical protein